MKSMGAYGIELILMRQLASCLAMPIAISDTSGQVIYLNEPAESLLGMRVETVRPLAVARIAERLRATDLDGKPLTSSELPMRFAIENRQPMHRKFRIVGPDGVERELEATAFPLVSQSGEHVGTVSVIWETRA
jgi:PAS domain-containing protein